MGDRDRSRLLKPLVGITGNTNSVAQNLAPLGTTSSPPSAWIQWYTAPVVFAQTRHWGEFPYVHRFLFCPPLLRYFISYLQIRSNEYFFYFWHFSIIFILKFICLIFEIWLYFWYQFTLCLLFVRLLLFLLSILCPIKKINKSYLSLVMFVFIAMRAFLLLKVPGATL